MAKTAHLAWGDKTLAFAEVAKQHGYTFDSQDYRNQPDPDKRVKQLLTMDLAQYKEIVLIGSSMGAYVAILASESIKPKGLFLLAPAFYLPGYQQSVFKPTACAIRVFHGWQDDIVAPENSWEFCRKHRVQLSIYDTDHRMLSALPQLAGEFDRFLKSSNGN